MKKLAIFMLLVFLLNGFCFAEELVKNSGFSKLKLENGSEIFAFLHILNRPLAFSKLQCSTEVYPYIAAYNFMADNDVPLNLRIEVYNLTVALNSRDLMNELELSNLKGIYEALKDPGSASKELLWFNSVEDTESNEFNEGLELFEQIIQENSIRCYEDFVSWVRKSIEYKLAQAIREEEKGFYIVSSVGVHPSNKYAEVLYSLINWRGTFPYLSKFVYYDSHWWNAPDFDPERLKELPKFEN